MPGAAMNPWERGAGGQLAARRTSTHRKSNYPAVPGQYSGKLFSLNGRNMLMRARRRNLIAFCALQRLCHLNEAKSMELQKQATDIQFLRASVWQGTHLHESSSHFLTMEHGSSVTDANDGGNAVSSLEKGLQRLARSRNARATSERGDLIHHERPKVGVEKPPGVAVHMLQRCDGYGFFWASVDGTLRSGVEDKRQVGGPTDTWFTERHSPLDATWLSREIKTLRRVYKNDSQGWSVSCGTALQSRKKFVDVRTRFPGSPWSPVAMLSVYSCSALSPGPVYVVQTMLQVSAIKPCGPTCGHAPRLSCAGPWQTLGSGVHSVTLHIHPPQPLPFLSCRPDPMCDLKIQAVRQKMNTNELKRLRRNFSCGAGCNRREVGGGNEQSEQLASGNERGASRNERYNEKYTEGVAPTVVQNTGYLHYVAATQNIRSVGTTPYSSGATAGRMRRERGVQPHQALPAPQLLAWSNAAGCCARHRLGNARDEAERQVGPGSKASPVAIQRARWLLSVFRELPAREFARRSHPEVCTQGGDAKYTSSMVQRDSRNRGQPPLSSAEPLRKSTRVLMVIDPRRDVVEATLETSMQPRSSAMQRVVARHGVERHAAARACGATSAECERGGRHGAAYGVVRGELTL
ncbi:hypothetical protein GGX14DRAFT_401663 [Mycena pura]|uniref:Uncharacterized protein n=1 Tax=Mycena pura TaxID=153505 RepID=A0AAD6Y4L6_9AGAR|nr:hypothetical protein GGX14DRAFT_401663 [Mycena pura]